MSDKHNTDMAESIHDPPEVILYKPLEFDPELCREEIDEFEGTEEEAIEILKIFFEISAAYAMMGHGMDPTQLALDSIFKKIVLDAVNDLKIQGTHSDDKPKELTNNEYE